jgi:hypothetical protein
MIRVLYKPSSGALAAASRGDLTGMATAMFNAHYYTGFGATPQDRINNQIKRMKRALVEISKAFDEPEALRVGVGAGSGRGGLMTIFAVGAAGLVAYLYWK